MKTIFTICSFIFASYVCTASDIYEFDGQKYKKAPGEHGIFYSANFDDYESFKKGLVKNCLFERLEILLEVKEILEEKKNFLLFSNMDSSLMKLL